MVMAAKGNVYDRLPVCVGNRKSSSFIVTIHPYEGAELLEAWWGPVSLTTANLAANSRAD